MVGDWRTARLGDLVDSSLGKMLDARKNKGTPRPYLGNSNVRWGSFDLQNLALMRFENHEEERYGIRDGDLIVCEGGEPGRCAIWREQIPGMKIQKALHRVRPKDGLNNYYLFYWFMLAGRTGRLEPFFTGTTIKHLTGKALNELEVPVPPIEEQRAIAHILGTLDDKIELNRRRNQTLEAMARALFKDWFVDFGPVRAKMAGLDPYLPADLWQLFPDRLDNEGMPDGWKSVALSELASAISKGTTPTKGALGANSDPAEINFLKVKNINECGEINRNSLQLIPRTIHESLLKRSILKTDDLLFSIAGTIGRVALVDSDMNDSNCNQAIAFVRLKDSKTFQSLCLLTLRSNQTQDFVRSKVVQGVQANASLATIGAIPVLVPNDRVLHSWNQFVSPLMEELRANQSQSRTLTQLRDTLLPKLISGELRIADAERFLETHS